MGVLETLGTLTLGGALALAAQRIAQYGWEKTLVYASATYLALPNALVSPALALMLDNAPPLPGLSDEAAAAVALMSEEQRHARWEAHKVAMDNLTHIARDEFDRFCRPMAVACIALALLTAAMIAYNSEGSPRPPYAGFVASLVGWCANIAAHNAALYHRFALRTAVRVHHAHNAAMLACVAATALLWALLDAACAGVAGGRGLKQAAALKAPRAAKAAPRAAGSDAEEGPRQPALAWRAEPPPPEAEEAERAWEPPSKATGSTRRRAVAAR